MEPCGSSREQQGLPAGHDSPSQALAHPNRRPLLTIFRVYHIRKSDDFCLTVVERDEKVGRVHDAGYLLIDNIQ